MNMTTQTPDAVRVLPSFLCQNDRGQFGVDSSTIGSEMCSSVTVGADASDVSDIVRAAIAQTSDMVSFKIRTPKFRQEWRRLIAPLANTVCPGEHIIANVSAALVHGTRGSGRGGGRQSGCGYGARPEIGEWRSWRRLGLHVGRFAIELRLGNQMKNDRRSQDVVDVGLIFDIPACASEDALKADRPAFPLLCKNEQVLTRGGMVADGAITLNHLHGAFLPLASVAKAPIALEAVAIADAVTSAACEEKYARDQGRRGNAAKPLAAEGHVNVIDPVVGSVDDKGPKHRGILPEAKWSGKAPARNWPGQSRHFTGFAPGVPHFANLPLAALQRVTVAAGLSGHFTNLPFASRQGAARAGVASRAAAVSAAAKIFMSNLSIGRLGCRLADRAAMRAAAPVRFAS